MQIYDSTLFCEVKNQTHLQCVFPYAKSPLSYPKSMVLCEAPLLINMLSEDLAYFIFVVLEQHIFQFLIKE